jgi:hypothetical protein
MVALAVVLLILGGLGLLYATDYGLEATVTQKGSDDRGHFIVATTKLLGVQVRRDVPVNQWLGLSVGNFLVYHIQSGHVTVYDREGGSVLYQG